MIEGDRNFAGKFTPGQDLEAWELNRVGEVASRGVTISSSGADTLQGSFGTVFMERPQPFVANTVTDFPFKVFAGFNDDGVEVTVRPGTVNNRIPKIASVYMDAATPPKLTIDQSGIWDILIKATKTVDSFFPDTVEVVAIKRDEWTNTDTVGYLLIASITLTGTAPALSISSITQSIYASQIVVRTKAGSATAIWNWTSR
jgi:hypothetical protein